jgi:wyosine [tRNA(Phe)-imidazoG37] synthetase (radical SAM superfamily)
MRSSLVRQDKKNARFILVIKLFLMKYVFGPVPSRRLGRSLGIDPIPLKTCNWNCVYCQLGRTSPLTCERKEFNPPEVILHEVEQVLRAHSLKDIDYVTFVGSGEPTLHIGLGWMIRQVKSVTDLPVAVITNGSLLRLSEVRHELLAADIVLPTLDAGDQLLYLKINRPCPKLDFAGHLDGLIAFREMFRGALWVEVMLIRGMNDDPDTLQKIAEALERIQPDQVHINQPTRPPAEAWARPLDDEGLLRARAILGRKSRVIAYGVGQFDLGDFDNLADAVLNIVTRHPMREEELILTLTRWKPGEVNKVIEELAEDGRLQRIERFGIHFWSAAEARFSDD